MRNEVPQSALPHPTPPPGSTAYAIVHPAVPVKVSVAMQAVQMLGGQRYVHPSIDGVPGTFRKLSDAEALAYDAALSVLMYYFRGEMDYAEEPRAVPVVVPKP